MNKKKFDVDTVWIKNPSIDQIKSIILLASKEIDKCNNLIKRCEDLIKEKEKEK